MGCEATLCGWVQVKRDMGGVIFLDVRDREGVAQVVCDRADLSEADFRLAEGMLLWFRLNLGWVVPAAIGFALGMLMRTIRKRSVNA